HAASVGRGGAARHGNTQHGGAELLHTLHGVVHGDIDFLVDRLGPQQVGDQTNTCATQPVAIKGGDVATRLLPPSKGGDGIVRVIRRHDVQHACGVRDATRYGTGFVLRGADGK